MGIGDVISKIFKNEDSEKKKNKDYIDVENLIEPPKPKAERLFYYKTINFKNISIKENE